MSKFPEGLGKVSQGSLKTRSETSIKFAIMQRYEFLYSDVLTVKDKIQLNSSIVDSASLLL